MNQPTAQQWKTALILFSAALLLFLLYAIPGFLKPELLMRIDSATYLGPAHSILNDFTYKSSPEATLPTGLRVPLYPLYLAFSLLIGGKSLVFCIVMNCLISALAVPLLYFAGLEFSKSEPKSVAAALLLMLSPTEIAFAPMFLSEGMFVTWVVLEILFMVRYVNRTKKSDLVLAAAAGGFAALTRPLNVLWILPFLFVAMFVRGVPFGRKCLRALLGLAVFALIVTPWIARNKSIGSGWRIDEVAADSLRHNASVVESRVNDLPANFYREKYAMHFDNRFRDKQKFPDRDSQLSYEEHYLTGIILKHKLVYFSMFFNPSKLVPDVPTFLENLQLTTGGKGTWDVIVKDGLWAGTRHYFEGKLYLPFLILPLMLILLATYLGAFGALICAVREKDYMLLLLFCLFSVYYLMVVGPGGYPRFQLPALPFLCLMASRFTEYLKRKDRSPEARTGCSPDSLPDQSRTAADQKTDESTFPNP